MTKHAVVIAGAGPTGLMLAAELALARVDVAIVERRESQELAGSRAGGLHARVSYRLDQNAPVNVRADLCTASDCVIWQAERTA
jgi:2-polyprenyl-6-methoxyphenol hydroxylase-like FAD-dependent oxidoreductase